MYPYKTSKRDIQRGLCDWLRGRCSSTYTSLHLMADGESICDACLKDNRSEILNATVFNYGTNEQWQYEGSYHHAEGPAHFCAHCNEEIESDYGDPDADPFEDSFMKPEVYKGAAWMVETMNGTECIPDDLVSLEEFVGDEDSEAYSQWLAVAIAKLTDYCEGAIIEVENAPRSGWLGRMSAPGYSDCTEWCLHETEQSAIDDLRSTFGKDN